MSKQNTTIVLELTIDITQWYFCAEALYLIRNKSLYKLTNNKLSWPGYISGKSLIYSRIDTYVLWLAPEYRNLHTTVGFVLSWSHFGDSDELQVPSLVKYLPTNSWNRQKTIGKPSQCPSNIVHICHRWPDICKQFWKCIKFLWLFRETDFIKSSPTTRRMRQLYAIYLPTFFTDSPTCWHIFDDIKVAK